MTGKQIQAFAKARNWRAVDLASALGIGERTAHRIINSGHEPRLAVKMLADRVLGGKL